MHVDTIQNSLYQCMGDPVLSEAASTVSSASTTASQLEVASLLDLNGAIDRRDWGLRCRCLARVCLPKGVDLSTYGSLSITDGGFHLLGRVRLLAAWLSQD